MTPDAIFYLIIAIVCVNFFIERLLSFLNLRHLSTRLPEEAEGIYSPENYEKSQRYLRKKATFGVIQSVFSFGLILLMLLADGFAFADRIAASVSDHDILHTLLFFGFLGFAYEIISIPFELYSIFRIEEEFGFNKTTARIYLSDKIKSWFLTLIIGGGLLAAITWIYLMSGKWFVIIALIVVGLFGVLMNLFYTQLIVPLFNKLKPLPDGELRDAIEDFASRAGFPLAKISVIDSSKRSSKSNAYFSGLGKKKRIVLFDTLIEKHTTQELVAVLAHETGHYKKKHIQMGLITGFIQTGGLLFLFYVFLGYPMFQQAIGAEQTSFHMGLVVFGILYSPVSMLLGILDNQISRKNEFAADRYAAQFGLAQPLRDALKKLSSDNLSNLTPHPAYVFVHYSHPPLLERLKALKKNG
jgi:STE24 endopeptidase